MKQLEGKTALVTGGSRGFGRDIVTALASEGTTVWALARDAESLEQLKRDVPGVQTLVADVADPRTAPQALRDIRPDIIVLNAGAMPTLGPVHEQSWEQFSRNWHTDVHMTFAFGKEALLLPLVRGSIVVIISSGAAIGGSPLSGGYAGAKRTQWFLAHYLQQEGANMDLGIRFVALIPKQISGDTVLGQAAVAAYSASQGISEQAFLESFGASLTPELMGAGVVDLLTKRAYGDGVAFGISGSGLSSLDGA